MTSCSRNRNNLGKHNLCSALNARRIVAGLLMLFVANALTLFAGDWNVDPSGPIKTIHEAVKKARNGDRVIIHGGHYTEGNIQVNKSIEIIGENDPVVDGNHEYEVFTITVDHVTVRGLVIRNSAISYVKENAAIKLNSVNYCTLIDNRLENNFFGIYLSKSSECRILNNTITALLSKESSSGNGIHLWNCRNVTIENNSISGHRDGIYFEFVKVGHITGNTSRNNLRYGLHFMFSDSCVYQNNLFQNNTAGVAVMYTKNITMTGNRFEDNWGAASYGILLKDISGSRITENIFVNNTVGIYAEGSNRNHVSQNAFIRNGWAVRVYANSADNTFTENSFVDNSFDVASNSRQNYNAFDRNYWSHYDGYDLNKDGVGDVPFRPVRLFSIIVEQYPPALVLLNSFVIDLLEVAERMIPALTPQTLIDQHPMIKNALAKAETSSTLAKACCLEGK